MDLSDDDSRPTYVQIADELRAQITSGLLPAGGKLPTARELMTRHGVASHTVQSALNILQDDGLTFSVHGRGTFVADDLVLGSKTAGPDSELVRAIERLHGVIDQLQAQVGTLADEIGELRDKNSGS